MMSPRLLLIFVLFLALGNASANLLPNPGFDISVGCPTNSDGNSISDGFASGWSTPTSGTSDYFNSCASGLGVPNNIAGTQSPFDGNAYAGLFAYTQESIPEYREYIQSILVAPLVAGQEYDFSFYVSLADKSYYAIDSIGAYFSVGLVGDAWPSPAPPLPFIPQVANSSGRILNDFDQWMLISGTFTAVGGENIVIIGNFNDDSGTPRIETGVTNSSLGISSYYYIDGVSLTPSAIPLPGAAWLFGSGLIGLIGIAGRKQA